MQPEHWHGQQHDCAQQGADLPPRPDQCLRQPRQLHHEPRKPARRGDHRRVSDPAGQAHHRANRREQLRPRLQRVSPVDSGPGLLRATQPAGTDATTSKAPPTTSSSTPSRQGARRSLSIGRGGPRTAPSRSIPIPLFRSSPSSRSPRPRQLGLYFRSDDVFWGVGSNDTTVSQNNTTRGFAHEWGCSLLPRRCSTQNTTSAGLLTACLCSPARMIMGVFLTAAQDNTTLFVDFDADGTADQPPVVLSRLQTQYVSIPTATSRGARFWATGPFSMAYGQNSDLSGNSTPALDLGYVAIPGTDFISLVLAVDKTASPQVVPVASGSQTLFTLTVNSRLYSIDGVAVADTLPPSWRFVPGSTTITNLNRYQDSSTPEPNRRANGTTAVVGTGTTFTSLTTGSLHHHRGRRLRDAKASPTTPTSLSRRLRLRPPVPPTTRWVESTHHYWSRDAGEPLHPPVVGAAQTDGDMAPNQQITIGPSGHRRRPCSPTAPSARTEWPPLVPALSVVSSRPSLRRTSLSCTTGTTEQIAESSTAPTPLYPGDTFTYTVNASNPGAAGANLLTGLSVYDPKPLGATHVAGSTTLSRSTVADAFNSRNYNLSVGTRSWGGNWTETDANGGGATGGNVQVNNNAELSLHGNNTAVQRIGRVVSLTGATQARLSFRYYSANAEAADQVLIRTATSGSTAVVPAAGPRR